MSVAPYRAMFAAISPPHPKNGRCYIDYTSVRLTASEARRVASELWIGGWADMLKKGWRIGKVDVVPHVPPPLVAKAPRR